jgi:ATP-dependent exoDNAse (exonuclease V) alpha subunit
MEDGYKHYYNGYLKKFKPDEIMALSPTKKGKLGTVAINKVIQNIVNPSDDTKKEIEFGEDGILRVGDYVINVKNTYGIINTKDKETEIVNGDKGIIYDLLTDWKPENKKRIIDDEEEEEIDLNGIYVRFDFDDIKINLQDKFQLLHAWCLTMHKSQGGNAKAVLVIADKAHKWQISANLLYTAITRATEYAVVICQADVINSAMKKVENLRRNTFLYDLLKLG